MFTIAHLVKVQHDLWPWMSFRGHLKVTTVKIANILLMVRDKYVVILKHLWEVDIGLSESIKKFDPGWPRRRHLKVTKVKIERGVLTVAPRPMVSIDKKVHHCPRGKRASWPLILSNLSPLYVHLKVTKRAVHPSNSWASCFVYFNAKFVKPAHTDNAS